MKTLVVFYSYTAHTKVLAQKFAAAENVGIAEIRDLRRPVKLKVFTLGILASIRGKSWPIKPMEADISAYDRLIVFSPVWASNPVPTVNALMERLPAGKTISVKMVSAGGKSECRDRMEAIIKAKGCTLESFEDIKS